MDSRNLKCRIRLQTYVIATTGVLDGNFLTQTTICTYRRQPQVVPADKKHLHCHVYFEPPLFPLDDHAKLPRVWHSYHDIVFGLQKCFLL
jgi:hypothetical protein